MTTEQKNTIEKYRQEYEINCKTYASWGSARDCSFIILKSQNPDYQTYVIVITTITGLSDDYQTYVSTINMMVEPDGNAFNLTDVFDSNDALTYLETLVKVN